MGCLNFRKISSIYQKGSVPSTSGCSDISSPAKEMLDHLESILANELVAVKSGQFIVEVKP
ncbi:hypothetical protein KY290_007946 [Solanum tuberosum]|uniref:Uncharacterized protein n=1 Tax=Solanum tuberosum TaxID=4113 RepID=A0ABQ7W953_SOLTU|nr:hypothetical protein KY290_007946 [Solanum tuberosum]